VKNQNKNSDQYVIMNKNKELVLDIHMYSLSEILNLFDLTYDISIEDLKRAKKTVLMTHPDKSGLEPKYFLFFKKAFDIVVHFYQQQEKCNQQVPTKEQVYTPINTSGLNKSTKQKISSVIGEMSVEDFQKRFNQLFEENMSRRPDDSKNEWFKKDEPSIQIQGIVNKQNMNEMFEKVKQNQSNMILAQYRGVENLSTGSGGSKLYEDLEDSDDNSYVVCDPFSKLKYDDLRKVHKDQTVIAVSETEYQKRPQYASVDHFMKARGNMNLDPMDKQAAERLLNTNENNYRQRMMQLEHRSNLITMDYAEKNKAVLSNFLRLT